MMKNELKLAVKVKYNQKGIQSIMVDSEAESFHWAFETSKKDQGIEHLVGDWLDSYSQKKPCSIQLPLDWSNITAFTRDTLKSLSTIPFGTLLSYGQVADMIGYPESARAVGSACGRNPFYLVIPCHRVVNAQFQLRSKSSWGISIKKKLLSFEDSYSLIKK